VTDRDLFFSVLAGDRPVHVPFFPDISTWYQAARLGVGTEQPFPPGGYIPDDDPIHRIAGSLDGRLEAMTFSEIYREFDWGLPVHVYDWWDERYTGGVEKAVETNGRHRTLTWKTPRGDLRRTHKLDAEGTWSEYGHMVGSLADLEIVRYIVEHTEWVPRYDRMDAFLSETEGFGIADTVVFRSPFGKLIHEYMGFEAVAFALFDHEERVRDFLRFQEHYDLLFTERAAQSPLSIVIISDHADQNLISPTWYREYCMPYYRKACEIIHREGKYASTHLDGNFQGYLPFIGETGFDLLDGCTPAPMFNYEVEELADALAPGMSCYCGVPATLFTTATDAGIVEDFGERIARAFEGRVVVNVGDILPPTGDLELVVRLGRRVRSLSLATELPRRPDHRLDIS